MQDIIRKNLHSLNQVLNFSVMVNREIAGNANGSGLSDFCIGDQNHVEPPGPNAHSVTFHVHVNTLDPPSGQDIANLLLSHILFRHQWSFIISPDYLYEYKLTPKLTGVLWTVLTKQQLEAFRDQLISQVNALARLLHARQIDMPSYVNQMEQLGVKIIAHDNIDHQFDLSHS